MVAMLLGIFVSFAHADRIIHVGDGGNVGMAVEKTVKGDIYLIVESNDAAMKLDFVPMMDREGGTVKIDAFGKPIAILQVFSTGVPDNSAVDVGGGRMHQRVSITAALKRLAKTGQVLRDAVGRFYMARDIKGVALVYYSLSASNLMFRQVDFGGLHNGTVMPIIGDISREPVIMSASCETALAVTP